MRKWLGTVVLAAVVAFLLIALRFPNTASGGDPGAARALGAVTTETFDAANPAASFPTDFATVMGYRPTTAIGPAGRPILIKPDGDCSGPLGSTGYDFDIVCKQHDLAYDVLRYATDIGAPLPASGRKAADGMFGRQLHARCSSQPLSGADQIVCHTIAESYGLACAFNGWRQGYHAPDHEPPGRWPAVALMFVGLMAVGPVRANGRRIDHRRSLHRFDLPETWPPGTRGRSAARRRSSEPGAAEDRRVLR